MKYTLSAKSCSVSEKLDDLVVKHVSKLNRVVSELNPGIVQLDIIVRKNKKRKGKLPVLEGEVNRNRNSKSRSTRKIDDPIYYDGTLRLVLSKKALVVNIYAVSIDKALSDGFRDLIREFKKYKGKHFVSDSKYPNRDTIRGNVKFDEVVVNEY